MKKGTKLKEPRLRSLLKPIDQLAQAANVLWLRSAYEARWLLRMHFFFKKIMKKSIFNVKFSGRPLKRDNSRNNSAKCNILNQRIESLLIINTFTLIKGPSNQTSFKLIN